MHVDMDGAADIARTHGYGWEQPTDPIFETGTANLLTLFEHCRIRATFFVISSSLNDRTKREWIRRVVDAGHSIGSHTVSHVLLSTAESAVKRREIFDSRDQLQMELGVEVRGFRAPGYRLDRESVGLLDEAGYTWDSSAMPTPVFASRLEVPLDALTAPGRPYAGSSLIELPLPAYRPLPVPFSPSYALLLGGWYFRLGVRRAASTGQPLVLLFHLVDLASPLARSHLSTPWMRLWTLSVRSARSKAASTERMLHEVQRHYRSTTTEELVTSIP